jgi:acetyl esterase/lipase
MMKNPHKTAAHGFTRLLGITLTALSCHFAAPAFAADEDMTPIAIPKQSKAITLGTGPLPDATAQESWHSQYGSSFARNVTEATLTPFLPKKRKATGAAVIVAPGGGFRTLSMSNEGWDVAKALADKGVAAFVLKYRLKQTPAEMADFEKAMAELFSSPPPRRPLQDPKVEFEAQITDSLCPGSRTCQRVASGSRSHWYGGLFRWRHAHHVYRLAR